MNLLVKFNHDWADEFSVYGFAIMSQHEFDVLKEFSKNMNWYFGTNEGWEDEDLSDGFSAQEISARDEYSLRLLFPELNRDSYGIFPNYKEIIWDKLWVIHDEIADRISYESNWNDTILYIKSVELEVNKIAESLATPYSHELPEDADDEAFVRSFFESIRKYLNA